MSNLNDSNEISHHISYVRPAFDPDQYEVVESETAVYEDIDGDIDFGIDPASLVGSVQSSFERLAEFDDEFLASACPVLLEVAADGFYSYQMSLAMLIQEVVNTCVANGEVGFVDADALIQTTSDLHGAMVERGVTFADIEVYKSNAQAMSDLLKNNTY